MIPTMNPAYRKNMPFAISIMNARHYPAHVHTNELEIILCLSGKATVVTAQDSFAIGKNQIVTIDQEDVHCIYSSEDNLLATVHLDLTKSEAHSFDDLRYRFIAYTTETVRGHQAVFHNDVRNIILALVYDYASGARRTKNEYQTVYEKLLDILVNNFSWPYKTDLDAEASDEIKNRLHIINKYVQQNYMNRITISQLSRLGNINENYFSQFMKKTSYGGFREMLAYVRCYRAEQLLLNSDYSGEQISNMCGFSSTKYYYRWFKHFWQRTPLQHKKWYSGYDNQKDEYTAYPPGEILPTIEKFIADDLSARIFEQGKSL